MLSISKKIKGLFVYLIGGYKLLENWQTFYIDLFRSFFKLKNKTEKYILRDGTIIKVHPHSLALNHVFYTVFMKGEYDSIDLLRINETDTVIDIGAHLGFFSIKAAKMARRGTIYAIEPFSKHFKLLKENIVSNNLNNVKMYNLAFSNKSEQISFYYSMHGDPGDTSLFKIKNDEQLFEEKVKSISLDEFFKRENLEVCNFMKLDCEGAEYSILINADISTLNKIQKIAMEWHRFEPSHEPQKLAAFLKSAGFTLIEPDNYNYEAGFLYAYRKY
jgi:FkbM family methyltransferase